MISFENVVKVFGKNTIALDNASFTIPKGVLAGLLGPNGSGKTTSFKLMLGILKPTAGKIRVFGLDPWVHEVEVKSRIGYLPEKPFYPTGISVEKFLLHIAKLKNVEETEVLRISRLLGITKLLDKKIESLSRGYLQRLGIAQALLGDPELLLLDEPTANLDPLSRVELLKLIKVLQEDLDATIVIATHILPELQPIVNYVVFINRGHIVDYGYLEELTHKYTVEAVYEVYCRDPRSVAKILIDMEFISGIEFIDGKNIVKVKINSGHVREFINTLNELQQKKLVHSFKHITSSLGDLYARLASKV